MTGLETKIFDYIEETYKAEFLGKVKVGIALKDTTVNVTSEVKNIKYGRLYNWYTVSDSRGIAPEGWHVPTIEEFNTLVLNLGSDKFESLTSFNWNPVLGGLRAVVGSFYNINLYGLYWASTYSSTFYADNIHITIGEVSLYSNEKNLGYSIRCIRDTGNNETIATDSDGNTYNSITVGTQTWLTDNLITKHYNNGDEILSDFSGTVGAQTAYNNDENNVYDTQTIITPTIVTSPFEYCLYLTLDNYMIPMTICYQAETEDEFFTYIKEELKQRNFPVIKFFKLKLIMDDNPHKLNNLQ